MPRFAVAVPYMGDCCSKPHAYIEIVEVPDVEEVVPAARKQIMVLAVVRDYHAAGLACGADDGGPVHLRELAGHAFPRALATGGGAGTRSLKARNALRRLVAGGFVASAGRGVYKLGPAGVAGADAAPKAKVKVGGAKAKAAEPEEHAGTGVTPWLGGGE